VIPGVGVAALEHPLEARHRCFAVQPQAGGAGAVPAPRGLAVAGQILLVVGGQLAGVVLCPAPPTAWRYRSPPRCCLPPPLMRATHPCALFLSIKIAA
jgi:hypothetical protein